MIELKIKLPDHFLDEEVRCGYLVSRKMKEVWAVELDLLAELQRVCEKYSIRYFASGGTMLGAVRHKGFIPWDDDIDIMMFRDDYEKLCNVAKDEFSFPYFFQTPYNDFGALWGHAKLRNSLTTGILMGRKYLKINQGIFIDIFPLDTVVDNEEDFMKQGDIAEKWKERAYFYSGFVPRCFYCGKNKLLKIIKQVVGFVLSPFFMKMSNYCYRKFDLICQLYNGIENSDKISTLSFMFKKKDHIKYREDYRELIDMDFEFMKIPVGKNFDHALSTRYGNYTDYVKGGSIHSEIFFDVDHSYLDYI